jgi:DNA-binding NarL/FixJ family response regulator
LPGVHEQISDQPADCIGAEVLALPAVERVVVSGLDYRCEASGDAVVAPSVTRRLIDTFLPHLPSTGGPAGRGEPPELATLTAREREILTEVATGLSNAEVAAKLTLAEPTVKTHIGHVLSKLQLRDRVQAVVYAYEHGLILPGTHLT